MTRYNLDVFWIAARAIITNYPGFTQWLKYWTSQRVKDCQKRAGCGLGPLEEEKICEEKIWGKFSSGSIEERSYYLGICFSGEALGTFIDEGFISPLKHTT